MATHYNITVRKLTDLEVDYDTVETGVRAEVEHLAELMGLGQKITTRKDRVEPEVTYHYYHAGRIDTRRLENQLTHGQRTGNRSLK